MKSKIFLVIIIAMVLVCASCRKTYTCECTTTISVPTGFGSFPIPAQSEKKAYGSKMTKKQAEANCDHEAESIESIAKAVVKEVYGSGSEQVTINTKCEIK
jgi:hypothetical protein